MLTSIYPPSPQLVFFLSSSSPKSYTFRSVPVAIKQSKLKLRLLNVCFSVRSSKELRPTAQVTRGFFLVERVFIGSVPIERKQLYKKMDCVTQLFKRVWHSLHSDVPVELALASGQSSLIARR